MIKNVRGAHTDLRSVRAPSSIVYLGITGGRIESLEGIERFENVDTVVLERARVDDLQPLRAMKAHIKTLRIFEPITEIDFDSIFELSALEDLWITHLLDEREARRIASGPFERLSRLKALTITRNEDFGIDMIASWFPELRDLEYVYLGRFGIREEDTEAICHGSRKLRALQFNDRSAPQTKRIAEAFGPGVVDTWWPPEPRHGEVLEIEHGFVVTIAFPRAEDTMEVQLAAERLLKGKWGDLAAEVDMEADDDVAYFHSDRREVLEELVRRATAAKLVN